jgi:hypothetical protein
MNKFVLIVTLALAAQIVSAETTTLAPAATASAGLENGFSGKVIETINTAGYTYVQVDTGTKKLWAATPQMAVQTGDVVKVAPGMPMEKYHSQSLKRDFDMVYFTGGITVQGADTATPAVSPTLPAGHPPLNGEAKPGLPAGHPPLTGQKTAAPKVDLTGIKRADGGKTVEEIFAGSAKLAGKPVSVRGKVVKYNSQIMGKNWLHIQDASGSADKKNNDLTVTTSAEAKLGDTVLISGNVTTNKDFGAGYKYSVIIEDAKVTVE